MLSFRLFARAFSIAGLCLLGASATYAQGIAPIFLGASPSGSNFNYAYRLDLLNDTRIDSNSVISFFDFSGLVGTPTFTSSFAGASFSASTPLLGEATADANQTDSPTIANASFRFNGANPITNTSGNAEALGTVNIISTNSLAAYGQWTPYGVNSINAQSSSPASNNSFVHGPNTVNGQGIADTPEPGTWALLVGSGVTGMALLRRRKSSILK